MAEVILHGVLKTRNSDAEEWQTVKDVRAKPVAELMRLSRTERRSVLEKFCARCAEPKSNVGKDCTCTLGV